MFELPEDMGRRIMQIGVENAILDFKDLCRLSLTCKFLYKLSGEDALWSSLLYQDFTMMKKMVPLMVKRAIQTQVFKTLQTTTTTISSGIIIFSHLKGSNGKIFV
ncbi:F-box SKIP24, partial [Olea europaea subsp. europaea]